MVSPEFDQNLNKLAIVPPGLESADITYIPLICSDEDELVNLIQFLVANFDTLPLNSGMNEVKYLVIGLKHVINNWSEKIPYLIKQYDQETLSKFLEIVKQSLPQENK